MTPDSVIISILVLIVGGVFVGLWIFAMIDIDPVKTNDPTGFGKFSYKPITVGVMDFIADNYQTHLDNGLLEVYYSQKRDDMRVVDVWFDDFHGVCVQFLDGMTVKGISQTHKLEIVWLDDFVDSDKKPKSEASFKNSLRYELPDERPTSKAADTFTE